MSYDRNRYERDEYERDRDDRNRYDRERSDRDRGMLNRATDEVRSWFGDDEAQRRRERDEDRYGSRDSGQEERWRSGAYGGERGYRPARTWSDESLRSEGYRDYGDRWGRSYGGAVDRPRDTYATDYGQRPLWSSSRAAGASQEFGPEAYGSPGAYESSRRYRRDARSTESWRVPGPYAGRGPKGYQRSAERIREEVNDRLTAHGLIDASDVEVQVQGGDVTLTGFVNSREAKRAAEECAEEVQGVRDVHNMLRVRTHAEDAEGVGRTSVLGLTEQETQKPSTTDPARSRARNP